MASLMKGFEHLEIQLEEIKSATNNFNEENVIGRGGFGKVFKGELSHSHSKGKSMVALKRLDRRHGQGDAEFYKEVRMLSCYRHENIISLLGFSCGRDEMILVYEYASRGSLDVLFEVLSGKLCFETRNGRLKILVPMWRQSYEEKQLSGIVFQGLMEQMNPDSLETFADIAYQCLKRFREERPAMSLVVEKLQESLALQKNEEIPRRMPKKYEEIVKAALPPLNYRSLNELKVLLKKGFHINEGKTILVPMWRQSYEEKQLSGIVFQGLMEQMNPDSLETFADIAYQCLKRFREERPAMSLVVEKLQESLALQKNEEIPRRMPKKYEEIVKAALPPLNYRSLNELKVLLKKGFHINEGKTPYGLKDDENAHDHDMQMQVTFS
ncbi:Phloem protein 2-like protein [Artemisia annua]|uniref:Phloem protein 2-like protein n=1 Tax=Artemisia annua TaxID=35608 RepID=A0A2U1KX53_ARTAN|nr:Phloem protein 2-like protein [Artemisia annua]